MNKEEIKELRSLLTHLKIASVLRTIPNKIKMPFPISKAFNIIGKDVEYLAWEIRRLINILEDDYNIDNVKQEIKSHKEIQHGRIKLSVLEWGTIKEDFLQKKKGDH